MHTLISPPLASAPLLTCTPLCCLVIFAMLLMYTPVFTTTPYSRCTPFFTCTLKKRQRSSDPSFCFIDTSALYCTSFFSLLHKHQCTLVHLSIDSPISSGKSLLYTCSSLSMVIHVCTETSQVWLQGLEQCYCKVNEHGTRVWEQPRRPGEEIALLELWWEARVHQR